MEQDDMASAAWFISTPDLQVQAGRPCHLEDRLQEQEARPSHEEEHGAAAERREARLQEVVVRSRATVQRAQDVAQRVQTCRGRQSAEQAATLCDKMEQASQQRRHRLFQREVRAARSLHRARAVASQQRDSQEQLTAQLEASLSETLAAARERRRLHLDDIQAAAKAEARKVDEAARKREERDGFAAELARRLEAAADRRERLLEARRTKRQEHLTRVEEVQKSLRDAAGAEAAPAEPEPAAAVAARALQTAFRWSRLQRPLRVLRRSPLHAVLFTVEPSYELLAAVLQDKAVLKAVRVLLARLASALGPMLAKLKNPHRVFLSALMMVFQPKVIFSDVFGEHEQGVQTRAFELVGVLRTWLGLVRLGFPAAAAREAQLAQFAQTWDHFVLAFMAWKNLDGQRLISGMVQHYQQLAELKQSISPNRQSPQAREWFPHVEQQQRLIRDKLRELGALDRLSALSAPVTRTGSPSPPPSSPPSSSTFEGARAAAQRTRRARTISDEHRARRSGGADGGAQPPSAEPESAAADADFDGADGEGAAAEVQQSVENGLLNAGLAHEIALDGQFQLEEMPTKREEKTERLMAALAGARRGRVEPAVVIDVVLDLRDGIFDCTLPRHTSLRGRIAERLDTDLIVQQVEHGAFDLHRCVGYILDTMAQLCAPSRDAELARLRGWASLEAFYEGACALLRHMRLDMANFHIKSIQPYIKQYAVEYERKKFDEAVASGALHTTRTTRWLASTYDALAAEADSSSGSSSSNGDEPSALACYEAALHRLLWDDAALTDAVCPETWLMDRKRMLTLRVRLRASVLVACASTLASGSVRTLGSTAAFTEELCKKLAILFEGEPDPEAVLPSIALQTVTLVRQHLERNQAARVNAEAIEQLQDNIIKLQAPSHPVRQLLRRRLQDLCRKLFREVAPSQELPSLDRIGFPMAAELVAQPLAELTRILRHHRAVFGPLYDSILSGHEEAVRAGARSDRA